MSTGALRRHSLPVNDPPQNNIRGWGHSRWLKSESVGTVESSIYSVNAELFNNISHPEILFWTRKNRLQSRAETMFLDAKLLLIAYLLRQAIALVGPLRASVSVKVRNGTVIGVNDERSQVQRFLGIPYAQPPVGDLRLRHAIPLNTSFDPLHAQSFGPACYGPEIDSNPRSSEDCLSLNIWRPAGQEKYSALKPVMVWFYGGGLQTGYTVRICCYSCCTRESY